MKLEIKDRDAFRRLSLVDVRAYLTSQGWSSEGAYGSVATIFSKIVVSGRRHEVLLPMRSEYVDYAARMADIVSEISVVEDRSQLVVFYDLIKSGFDVIRFRAPQADDAGTIPLENGVALYDHARDLIAAVANAAIKPKRAYRSNSSAQAKDYVTSLRLGQTEVGSYVLTILSPVTPTLESEQIALFPELAMVDEPFPRTVTKTLVGALRATKEAAAASSASGKLDPFEAAIESGVSANLCEAIARLVERGDGVEISVGWSQVRPAPEAFAVYRFDRDNARILSEVATKFREREPQPDITIEGFVVALHRQPHEFDGRAKIRGFVEGRGLSLWTNFILSDYQKVVEAHDKKMRIRLDGEIVKRGQFFTLENPRNLFVFEDDYGAPEQVEPTP